MLIFFLLLQVSYLIVDEMHQEHPELIKDQYWDEVLPDLPYTAAAMPFYTQLPEGSAANLVYDFNYIFFIYYNFFYLNGKFC